MKKKKLWLVTGVAAAAVLAAGTVTFAYQSGSDSEEQTVYKEVTVEKGNLTAGVTESGSVTIGTLDQTLDFSEDSSSASTQNNSSAQNSAGENATSSTSTASTLEVETVYVIAGQSVAEGDPILKLTEESVASYKKDLEEAVTEAKTAVSEAGLSAEKQKVSASYSYNLSTAEGSVAQETYEAAIKQLQEAVDDAQEAVDTSASLINYYQEQIDAGVDLSASLTEEQENYDKLYTKLVAAKNNYTTKSIEAEKTLKEAELSAKNASSQYSVDVSGADNDITDAKDTLSDAEEALEEFETAIGDDGTIYAEYTGTITDLEYEEGDTISSGATVASGISPDDSIFIPYATGVKYLVGSSVSPTITVLAADVNNVEGVIEEVTEVLATSYPNAEFTFEDAGSKMEAAEASNQILTMLLIAMAAIVFVVGGIGIMNVLFVSVKERTNEIGILKAIGCSKRDILLEFLAEAAAISLIGGVLGNLASLAVAPIVQYLGVRVELSASAFLIALVFAVGTGTIFGFYPAYNASNLVPVEALGAE